MHEILLKVNIFQCLVFFGHGLKLFLNDHKI